MSVCVSVCLCVIFLRLWISQFDVAWRPFCLFLGPIYFKCRHDVEFGHSVFAIENQQNRNVTSCFIHLSKIEDPDLLKS